MTALRSIAILFLTLTLAGCGADWFPGRQPTAPDTFTFPSKTGVAVSTSVESDAITVAGLKADSSPISVSGSVGSNSTYTVNGGTPTSAGGTVKNGDVVKVQQTSASALGTDAVTTLVIGGISGTFTSTTVPVVIPTFAAVTVAAGTLQTTSGTIQARDGLAGTHQVSVANGFFSLDNENNFVTSQFVSNLNSRTIFLRTTALTTSGGAVNVTLTIDGVTATWVVNTQ